MSKERLSPCPYHTTLTNGRLFGPRHPCFTVYDAPVRPEGIEPPTIRV